MASTSILLNAATRPSAVFLRVEIVIVVKENDFQENLQSCKIHKRLVNGCLRKIQKGNKQKCLNDPDFSLIYLSMNMVRSAPPTLKILVDHLSR